MALCDYVVFGHEDEKNSRLVLKSLEQENMFPVPLNNQRRWCCYHHLFAEMLFHWLGRSFPTQIPALHRKASEWFEANGFIPEALEHALASKDWDHFSVLMNRHAMPMIFQGYPNLVIGWCREIPRAHREASPNICIYCACALVLTFRNDYLATVDEQLENTGVVIESPDLPASAEMEEK